MSRFIPIVLMALLTSCAVAPAVPNLHAKTGAPIGYPAQVRGTPTPGHCSKFAAPIAGQGATIADSGGPCGGNFCLAQDSSGTGNLYWRVCNSYGLTAVTVAELPVCDSSTNGQREIVTNSGPVVVTDPVVGGGSIWAPVECLLGTDENYHWFYNY